jgi:hypothetical protein
MNKKGIVVEIVIIGILLVVGFFWFTRESGLENGLDNETLGEAVNDKLRDYTEGECIKVQTTCCPCNMGGKEECVLKDKADEYKINPSECSENLVCAAMYNCQIESCEYVDGKCIAV